MWWILGTAALAGDLTISTPSPRTLHLDCGEGLTAPLITADTAANGFSPGGPSWATAHLAIAPNTLCEVRDAQRRLGWIVQSLDWACDEANGCRLLTAVTATMTVRLTGATHPTLICAGGPVSPAADGAFTAPWGLCTLHDAQGAWERPVTSGDWRCDSAVRACVRAVPPVHKPAPG